MHSESIKLEGKAGHAIAASIEGARDGMPVILAHGGGQTRRAWKKISTLLAGRGFHAIAIDLRGHGDPTTAPLVSFALSTGVLACPA